MTPADSLWWDELTYGSQRADDEFDYSCMEPGTVEPLCDMGDVDARAVLVSRLSKYGLGFEQYEAMLVEQCASCKICGTHTSETSRGLVIDHCHVTGKVRGLLCNACNAGLGMFRDSEDSLMAAAAYLRDSRE